MTPKNEPYVPPPGPCDQGEAYAEEQEQTLRDLFGDAGYEWMEQEAEKRGIKNEYTRETQ